MKTNNIILFILLLTAKLLFTMENDIETEKITFQHIPIELYADIAQQGIISIVNESSDVFFSIEKATEFIKKMKLISQIFRTELTQKPVLRDLITTLQNSMKEKFPSDFTDLGYSGPKYQLKRLIQLTPQVINYCNEGKKKISSIINKSSDIFTAIEGANKVLNEIRLLSKPFSKHSVKIQLIMI